MDDGEALRRWAGKDADGCFDNPDCPLVLWGRTDARLAVVLGVGHTDTGLSITVRLYDPTHQGAIREIRDVVPSGAELAFAKDVAVAVNETIAGIPRRTAPVLVTEEPPPDRTGDRAAEEEALRAAEALAEAEEEARREQAEGTTSRISRIAPWWVES